MNFLKNLNTPNQGGEAVRDQENIMDGFGDGMQGLRISDNDGTAIGRGRGFGMQPYANGCEAYGLKTTINNNIPENNEDDGWCEDEAPVVSQNSGGGGGGGWQTKTSSNSGWQSDNFNNKSNSSQNGNRACFNCGNDGHMSRECPNPKKSGGGGSRACFKCNEEGHMSRECPNAGSGGGGRACYKCNEEGHMARDCPNAGSGGGGGGRACYKCNEEGHMARDCPTAGSGGGGGGRACFKCNEEGHMSRECPNAGSGGGGGGRACFKCKQEGHMSRDCPEAGEGGGGGSGRGCFKCNKEGHMARDCPEEDDGSKGANPGPSTYEPEEIPNDEEHLFAYGINSGINFSKYDNIKVQMSGANQTKPIRSFQELNLEPKLQENIQRASYQTPTPIQKHAIPAILNGQDLMGCAQTGSGKTAAFLLPIIQYMLKNNIGAAEYKSVQEPTAIIVAPTRELAIQIHNEAKKFAFKTQVRSVVIYGGTAVSYQLSNLMEGCHILVATPGRMLDFINRGKIKFDSLKFLILDEADRMLDMGFMPDIKKLVAHSRLSSIGKQTLMFSATFPNEIQELAREFLEDYLFLAIGQVGGANSDVTQRFYQLGQFEKRDKLMEILRESGENDRTLIFVEKKRNADFIATYLCLEKFRCTSIHGDRQQSQREEALADFRSGRMPILTATAVAARGLDIRDVRHVINYDLPKSIDEYVHRIGRTGRVGNLGKATSFYDTAADSDLSRSLVKILAESQQEVPDWLQNEAGSAVGTSVQSFGGASRGGFGARDVRNNASGGAGGMSAVVSSAPDDEDWG